MEFKNFDEFYNKAEYIAGILRKTYPQNLITTKLVENFIEQNPCISLGDLPLSIQIKLKSYSKELRISFCNLVKNIAKHSEIDIKMYKNIINIINIADTSYINKEKVIFEKTIDKNLFQLVIKTTKNKQENYFLSYYKANHKKR